MSLKKEKIYNLENFIPFFLNHMNNNQYKFKYDYKPKLLYYQEKLKSIKIEDSIEEELIKTSDFLKKQVYTQELKFPVENPYFTYNLTWDINKLNEIIKKKKLEISNHLISDLIKSVDQNNIDKNYIRECK